MSGGAGPGTKVIITGDDLGHSPATTAAVLHALGRGWISHSSVLANLPDSDAACATARASGFGERIGLHVNFSEGRPITEALRRDDLFCAGGAFRPVEQFARYRPLEGHRERLVADEVRAQYQILRRHGITPSHLDSHNDVHIAPSIAAVIAAVGRELGMSRVRPARNCGTRQGVLRRVHHRAYNRWLRRNKLSAVHFLGTVDDMEWLARAGRLTPDHRVEVVTHPRATPLGDIVDAPSDKTLAQQLDRLKACFESLTAAPG